MKIKLVLLNILAISVLIFPALVLAESPPPIPLLIYGNVTIDGQPAPTNTEITAEIDGSEVATASMVYEGKYFIEIPDGKANEGKIIIFKVNGIADDNNQHECANIDTVPSIKFDLAVTTPASESAPAPTSSGGGGGGGGGGTAPSQPTTPTPLSEAAKKMDTNLDDKIDILDFNSLMVNWGQEESGNIADFDNSGLVDIFDFNLLMIYWTE